MISMLPRSKHLQSMTSQELVELSQLEHDTLLSKLSSCKISLPSQVQIYGLLSSLTSPGLHLQRYSSLSSTSKIIEQSLPTLLSLNKLMDNEWFKLFKNNFIRKWELPLELDMIMIPTLKVNSLRLPKLQLALV